jgi:hypothetical protein
MKVPGVSCWVAIGLLSAGPTTGAQDVAAASWRTWGMVEQYEIGLSEAAPPEGRVAARVASRVAAEGDFAGIVQAVAVEALAGEAVRVGGQVKTEAVEGWAGLFARVDDAAGRLLRTAEAQAEPTQEWARHELSIEIPPGGAKLSFGLLLQGRGAAMADALSVAVADPAAAGSAGAQDLGFEARSLLPADRPWSPQKETVRRMRQAAAALRAWQAARGAKPAAAAAVKVAGGIDWRGCGTVATEDLAAALARLGLEALPRFDGWGRPLEYCAPLASGAAGSVGIRSAGADGVFDATIYAPGEFPAGDQGRDIVWIDGFFVVWPAG